MKAPDPFTQKDDVPIWHHAKVVGIGFLIFLFLVFVSTVPFMLENAKTPQELRRAIIIFCIGCLTVLAGFIVRWIRSW